MLGDGLWGIFDFAVPDVKRPESMIKGKYT